MDRTKSDDAEILTRARCLTFDRKCWPNTTKRSAFAPGMSDLEIVVPLLITKRRIDIKAGLRAHVEWSGILWYSHFST